MNDQSLKSVAALEALLFIHGEPLLKKKIMSVLQLEPEELDRLLESLKAKLEAADSGLALLTSGDKVQLVTRPEFGSIMTEFVKDELTEDLTPASLEALSLILYLGPVPRSQLDYLRGVNSSFIIRNLMLRGLVERYPDPEHVSTYLYRASADALRHLGVTSAEELPEYDKFKGMAEMESGEGPLEGKKEDENEEKKEEPV